MEKIIKNGWKCISEKSFGREELKGSLALTLAAPGFLFSSHQVVCALVLRYSRDTRKKKGLKLEGWGAALGLHGHWHLNGIICSGLCAAVGWVCPFPRWREACFIQLNKYRGNNLPHTLSRTSSSNRSDLVTEGRHRGRRSEGLPLNQGQSGTDNF